MCFRFSYIAKLNESILDWSRAIHSTPNEPSLHLNQVIRSDFIDCILIKTGKSVFTSERFQKCHKLYQVIELKNKNFIIF